MALCLAGCGHTRWSFGDGGELSAAPLRIGDAVLVAQDLFGVKFTVTALDWETGRPLWTQPEAGWSRCTELLGDSGGAFVVCGDIVTALDPETGRIRWRTELVGEPAQAPLLGDEGLVVRLAPPERYDPAAITIGPGHGEAIHGDGTLDPATTAGKGADDTALVWRWMAGYPPAYAWLWMAMDDVVGSADLPIVKDPTFEAPTPDPLTWRPDLSAPFELSPREGLEGWGSGPLPGRLPERFDPDPEGSHLAIVLDRLTGEERLHVRGSARGPLIWVGGRLVWVAQGVVSAVEAEHGTLSWQHPSGALPGSEAQVKLLPGTATVYMVSAGRVEALDAYDGDALWSMETAGRVDPLLAPERLLYLEGGQLKALSLATGQRLWQAPAPGVVDQPLIAGDVALLKTASGDVLAISLADGAPRWRAAVGAKGAPFLVGESYRWVQGVEVRGLSLSGEPLDPIPLPRPGLEPGWTASTDLASLAPVVRGDEALLRVDAHRAVMLEL